MWILSEGGRRPGWPMCEDETGGEMGCKQAWILAESQTPLPNDHTAVGPDGHARVGVENR